MAREIHFISGLPRSGSTLLSAILSQNPEIYAGISTPAYHFYCSLQGAMSGKHKYHPLITPKKRKAILRGVITNYHADVVKKQIVLDTNRAWTCKIGELVELFPNCKMICCVRSLSWILDSVERIVAKNPLEPASLFSYEPQTTIYGRAETMMNTKGFVGFPLSALMDAYHSNYRDRLFLLDYDHFVKSPEKSIESLYAFMGWKPFQHDFDNVEFDVGDIMDDGLGLPGLHKVGKKVEYIARESVLPPDLFKRYNEPGFWSALSAVPRPAAPRPVMLS